MAKDLRDRLRQLGVHKGAAKITPKAKPQRQTGIESLVDGEIVETDYGPAFVHVERYAPGHVHGISALSDLAAQSWLVAGRLANLDGEVDLRRAAFIDTETTGLAGGTGTLAFLIGVGVFEEDGSFMLRQFFLRSPAEEPAILLHLSEWLDQYDAIVSFNGRGFDLPLLQTRFIMHRMRPGILSVPHLDLLPPARRVWRGRLASCALSSLEYHILDVHRDQVDIDGALIPQLYVDYVRTGDASEMPRVLYHNAHDILSLVTLATCLIQIFDEEQVASLTPADLYALGKWHADRAEYAQAERYLRKAIEDISDAAVHHQASIRLGALYKQLDRRADAIELWQGVALHPVSLTPAPGTTASAVANVLHPTIEACIELAKYYEWHAVDLAHAMVWTEHALDNAALIHERFNREETLSELQHRRKRLAGKLARIR